jgi:hypothetical protein
MEGSSNWYKHTGDRPPCLTQLDLQRVTNEYKLLYQATLPPGDPLNTYITPCQINDELPNESEIAAAVRKLKNVKAPGHSGIRAEHI